MPGASSVTVGIVNYNGGSHLIRLLDSLSRQTAECTTLVIDNASTDGSLRAAYERHRQFTYVPLRSNTGFAHAANLIVQRSGSEIVVLINPDTVLERGFIEAITTPLQEKPNLAAVAGTLTFASHPETIASAGIAIHRNGVAIDRLIGKPISTGSPAPVFGASGGAAAYRRSAFLRVGGFPAHFFMYLEDVDLAFRLQLAGWDALWQPEAVATHAYSASAGEGSPFKRRLIARNRIWTLARCFPNALLPGSGLQIAAYDAAAVARGIAVDRHSLLGRAEGLAMIVPRLCERRAIDPDGGDVDRLRAWMSPSISPAALRRRRRITAQFASNG